MLGDSLKPIFSRASTHLVDHALATGDAIMTYKSSMSIGVRFLMRRNSQHDIIDVEFSKRARLGDLHRSFDWLYPRLFPEYEEVDTRPWPGALFSHLDDRLVGPRMSGLSDVESLRTFLGRIVHFGKTKSGIGRRFVEPGIGRTVL